MSLKGKGVGYVADRGPGKMLQIRYYDLTGELRPISSGHPNTPEGWAAAERRLKLINHQMEAEREFFKNEEPATTPEAVTMAITLHRFCVHVMKARKTFARDVKTEEMWVRRYIFTSILADMIVKDIRSSHIRDFLTELKTKERARVGIKASYTAKGIVRKKRLRSANAGELDTKTTLSPKSIRNVFGVLRVIFTHAIEERLIEANANPCIGLGMKRILGKQRDADPNWRRSAVYSKEEASMLMGDPRVPESSRVLYTAFFFTGMRHNEAASLKFKDIDTVPPILPALNVWDEKLQTWRVVPIHPTFRAALAEWKMTGWQNTYGRKPEPDDLIFPTGLPNTKNCTPAGAKRDKQYTLRRLHQDFDTLGMRWRRTHDMRRTFISLAESDGASEKIIKWVTHAPDSWNIMAKYTTLEWAALCREISKLDLKRAPAPATNLIPMKKEDL